MEKTTSPQQSLFEMPPEQRDEYRLLRGHYRTNGTFKNDEQLRSEYVQLTDDIIYKMTNGVEVTNPESGLRVKEKPEVVVWLDKSARPVSWLTRELWPTLARQQDGTIPRMPHFRFVNIDREQWVNQIDPQGSGRMDINKVDPSVIRSLRSIFVPPTYKKEGLTEDIERAPTELDGKTVLLIDEVKASGRTLDISRKFFEKAFPKAKLATTHWMGRTTTVGGAIGNADLPVWYKEKDIRGRGVGNRDERISKQSDSRTQRLGAWFLSTRLAIDDPDSAQLRKELHQLAQDVEKHKVLVVPSMDRDDDDYIDRAARLNGVTFDEFQAKKARLLTS